MNLWLSPQGIWYYRKVTVLPCGRRKDIKKSLRTRDKLVARKQVAQMLACARSWGKPDSVQQEPQPNFLPEPQQLSQQPQPAVNPTPNAVSAASSALSSPVPSELSEHYLIEGAVLVIQRTQQLEALHRLSHHSKCTTLSRGAECCALLLSLGAGFRSCHLNPDGKSRCVHLNQGWFCMKFLVTKRVPG